MRMLLITTLFALIGCTTSVDAPPSDKGTPLSAGKADHSGCDYDWSGASFACWDSWIGAGDGCDCGCDVIDPDCACPEVHPPAPGSCGGATPTQVWDEWGRCVLGFECPCPEIHPPPPESCTSSSPEPVRDDTGCVVAYRCGAACPEVHPPPPGFCDSISPVPVYDDAGCVVSFECPDPCPQIHPPAPGFCGDTDPTPVYDGACIVGFECEGSAALCTDACRYASDGECDDGGPGSDYSLCELGTDCTDCGPRTSP